MTEAEKPVVFAGHASPALPDPAGVAREAVRLARRALRPPGDVHGARKHLKRARALLRLCETGEAGAEAAALRRELRDAGRELAGLRDREAVLEALHDLDGERRIPPEALARLRAAGAHDPETDAEVQTRVRRSLRSTGRTVEGLVGGAGPEAWLSGLGATYRRARKAYRAALAHPTGDRLHALRKRAKDLRYQVEWLAPLWPRVLSAWEEELHALTDALGRTQDVRVAREQAGGAAAPGERRRVALILWDLRRDGRRARREALRMGRRLFAEGAGSFERRLGALAKD